MLPVRPGHLDREAHPDNPDIRADQDSPDHLANHLLHALRWLLLARFAHQERLATLEAKDLLDLPVEMDNLAHLRMAQEEWAHLDHQDLQVLRDILESLEDMELPETLEHPALQDAPFPARKARLERLANPAILEDPDNLDTLEAKDHPDLRDNLDTPDSQEDRANRERLEHQERLAMTAATVLAHRAADTGHRHPHHLLLLTTYLHLLPLLAIRRPRNPQQLQLSRPPR